MRCRLNVLVVDRNKTGVPGVNETHVDIDARRRDLFDVAFVLGKGPGRSHAGHEAHGDFGDSPGGNNRLCSCSGEAAGDAVHIKGGASPGTLEDAVAVFADELA